jgi:hypothetical protein
VKKFVEACVLPVLLYCSPVIFSGLLTKDFILLRRSMKVICRVSGIQYAELVEIVVSRHIDSALKFAHKILEDSEHPLHQHLSLSVSRSCTRNTFNPVFSRTSTFRRSIVPFLARLLTDASKETALFEQMLFK